MKLVLLMNPISSKDQICLSEAMRVYADTIFLPNEVKELSLHIN